MLRLSEKRHHTLPLHSRIRLPEYVPYLSSNLLSIKIPFLFPRGFSANLILLLWYFCGGVLLWGFEGNILSLMFKQVFEDPVDTAQDIYDRGLIPLVFPDGQHWVETFAQSNNDVYKKLAKTMVVPTDWDELYYYLTYHVQGNGTHVLLGNHVWDKMREFGLYHFSQEIIEGSSPYGVWIISKLFPLSNELAKHILIYQQVCQLLF